MKKIISLILVTTFLFVATECFAAPGWQTSPGAGDIMGNGRGLISAPHKTFRMVRYMPVLSGVALLAGDLVIWSDSASGDDGVSITTTIISDDSRVAGVCATAIPLPASETVYKDGSAPNTAANDRSNENWGWLQTYGYCTVNVGAGEVIQPAGIAMGTSETTGKAGGFVASTAFEHRNGNAGFFYDAAAASATGVEAFVKCE